MKYEENRKQHLYINDDAHHAILKHPLNSELTLMENPVSPSLSSPCVLKVTEPLLRQPPHVHTVLDMALANTYLVGLLPNQKQLYQERRVAYAPS